MKKFSASLFITCLSLIFLATVTFAQNASKTSKDLLNEGIELHDAEKYDEAIEKYKAALQIDPGYQTANYEIGNTLYTQDKYDDAIIYLTKVINANKTDIPDAYNLLGNIYDDKNDPEKAISLYKKGIAIDPDYQRLHFNLAICYYRQGNHYKEAEAEIQLALKLEPGHASSHLLYGNIAYYQKKNNPAILGFCSFLLKEGTSKKSESALTKLKDLLTGGEGPKLSVYASFERSLKAHLELATLNFVSNGTDVAYKHFFADFFRKLVDSPVFPAFSRYISVTGFNEENMAWFKENPTKAQELDDWVASHPRSFTE